MANPERGAGGAEKKQDAGADAGEAAGGEAPARGGLNPKQLATQRIIGAAKRFNRAHPEDVATFDKLTNGTAQRGIRAIMAWQQTNGCHADGKIGPATVEAAKAKKGHTAGEKKDNVDGAEKEEAPVNIFANEEPDSADDGPVLENPALMSNITDGAKGMEKRNTDELGETLDHGGEALQKGAEGLAQAGVVEEMPWMKAAMAPEILHLIQKGEIGAAAWKLVRLFSATEVVEAVVHASEKIGLEMSTRVVTTLAKVALGLDVVFVLFDWTIEGFKQIREAHEAGDHDSRVRMYARAFAEAYLYGQGVDGGMAGALTPEQKEAVKLGIRDGSRTAGGAGHEAQAIGRELLRKYGSADGAKRAIMDQLCIEAGQPGIWSQGS